MCKQGVCGDGGVVHEFMVTVQQAHFNASSYFPEHKVAESTVVFPGAEAVIVLARSSWSISLIVARPETFPVTGYCW